MKNSKSVKFAAPLLVALMASVAAPGCGEDGPGGNCEANISAKVEALDASITALVDVSGDMKASLYAACSKIANMPGDKMNPTDAEVTSACDAAATIVGSVRASATGGITIVPARCSVNASAQLSCEGSCNVEAECKGGDIKARCSPGELSVACEGSCMGEARCEGEANAAVNCEGTCGGTCEGTCEGTCNGECEGTCSAMGADGKCAGTCTGECKGSCSAKCTGECKGSCTLAANATVMCDAQLRCKGECTGTATAPECEAELTPPTCQADADCQAACEGQASFKAECTPPSVSITGAADIEAQARVVANLPAILEVAAKAQLAIESAGEVATSAGRVVGAVAGSVSCAAEYAADLKAQAEAAVSASASVNVSVMASASVSGEASGGT
jgi:hypothetical protein